jgi:hypothetical protein
MNMTKNGRTVEEMTDKELWFKLKLVKFALKCLKEHPYTQGHPKQAEAIQREEEHLRILRAEIAKRQKQSTEINLKPAVLKKRVLS